MGPGESRKVAKRYVHKNNRVEDTGRAVPWESQSACHSPAPNVARKREAMEAQERGGDGERRRRPNLSGKKRRGKENEREKKMEESGRRGKGGGSEARKRMRKEEG